MKEASNQIKKNVATQRSVFKELMSWIKVMLLAVLIGMAVSYFIKPTLVSGKSMFPTLDDQDYLILNRFSYKIGEPQRKDIVVFRSHLAGNRILIKRVIATEGEKIVIKDGKVYVNDRLLNESYVKGNATTGDFEGIVPKNKLFVMGDNRGNSIDSRRTEVGFVSKDEIIGKVWFRLIPLKGIEE
ncbi:signal peptidase I (plasmid) [Brevibacillus halotolerans]|nr:signal peptidase I [Brevibacillus halotolerans]